MYYDLMQAFDKVPYATFGKVINWIIDLLAHRK